jgi:hypothetical protein
VLVNLDQRTWPNQGKERVILKSDVPAKPGPQVQLLQKTDGNLLPAFKHARNQVRPRKLHTLTKVNRKHNRLPWQFEIRATYERAMAASKFERTPSCANITVPDG